MRTFVARFPGRCAADCDEPIREGDRVVYVEDRLVHEGCEPVTPRIERPTRICVICHLAKPCDCD